MKDEPAARTNNSTICYGSKATVHKHDPGGVKGRSCANQGTDVTREANTVEYQNITGAFQHIIQQPWRRAERKGKNARLLLAAEQLHSDRRI